MTFADTALRWSWLSATALGWRPNEFWQSTPQELASALNDPEGEPATAPSRDLINTMMERDSHG